MTLAGVVATPQHHEVLFYEADRELAAAVADYAGAGLADGELVVVIATAAHLAAIDEALSDIGVDASLARASGSFLALDAVRTLDWIMVNGSPDSHRFTLVAGGMLDAAATDGRAVRFFGEMVALLWRQGDVPGAMALEASWNDLGEARQFSLVCAYPMTALGTAALDDVNEVCQAHSLVLPPASYTAGPSGGVDGAAAAVSKVFVAVPEAVYAARRFVRETLTSWGEEQLVWDAALIISELATNAIIHGGSPFRASVERAADVVRIAVEDVGPGLPQSRRAFQTALGGRGVAIVEELSHRWGCDRLAGGKVFWVELEATVARAH